MYTYLTSGMTFADWLIVTRYFSVAASIAIAWVAAGTAVSSIYFFTSTKLQILTRQKALWQSN